MVGIERTLMSDTAFHLSVFLRLGMRRFLSGLGIVVLQEEEKNEIAVYAPHIAHMIPKIPKMSTADLLDAHFNAIGSENCFLTTIVS